MLARILRLHHAFIEFMPEFLAVPYDGVWRPDRMLRIIAIAGLTGVGGFIIAFHRSLTALCVLAVGSAVFVYVEHKINHESFSQNLQQMFKF